MNIELIKKQLEYHNRIREVLKLNIVNCGHCDAVIVHEKGSDEITCPSCETEMDVSDCPDIYYSGMEIDGITF